MNLNHLLCILSKSLPPGLKGLAWNPSSRSAASPRVSARESAWNSFGTGPSPARRSRWRRSASVKVAPAFTGMKVPPVGGAAASVGARHPNGVVGRSGFDPQAHDVDEEGVELGALERHARPEQRIVQVAGDLVVQEAGLG